MPAKKILYVTFILALLLSCSEENTCFEEDENLWSVRLGSFSEFSDCHVDLANPKNEANFIVQSEEQFNALFSCSFSNEIFSFDHYSILAGRIMTPGGGRVLKQWISHACGNIIFHVEIGWGHGEVSEAVTYAALVDKIIDNGIVQFDVSVLTCSGGSETEPETILISAFPSEYICSTAYPVLHEGVQDYGFVTINNSADFVNYFQCEGPNGQQLPQIDFELNTVLAGRIVGSSTSTAIRQIVERKCDAYYYLAEILPGLSTDVAPFGFYVMVPKIPNSATVYFDWRYVQ